MWDRMALLWSPPLDGLDKMKRVMAHGDVVEVKVVLFLETGLECAYILPLFVLVVHPYTYLRPTPQQEWTGKTCHNKRQRAT